MVKRTQKTQKAQEQRKMLLPAGEERARMRTRTPFAIALITQNHVAACP
jgi:hypothetical protein